MGIDNIRHPIKDTVKADNSTYSSNKIESLIHSATELPETTIEDAGDVLIVNNEGKWAKGDIIIPQEVPIPSSGDTNKTLVVGSTGNYEFSQQLPIWLTLDKSGSTYYFKDETFNIMDVFNDGLKWMYVLRVLNGPVLFVPFEKLTAVNNIPVARFSAVGFDGTDVNYYYIDIPVTQATPITGLTINSIKLT